MSRRSRRFGFALLATLVGCQSSPSFVIVHQPVASVTITPSIDSIPFQGAVSLQVATYDLSGTPTIPEHHPVWSSLTPSVLIVDTVGMVTSIWYGPGIIRVQVDGKEATASIFVGDPPIDTFWVSPLRATIERNDTLVIAAAALNAARLPNSTAAAVWRSSDSSVVRVDSTGHARGVGLGTAVVRVTLAGLRDSTVVSVLEPVAAISVTPTSLSLGYDRSDTLRVVATDGSGTRITDRDIAIREILGSPAGAPGAVPAGETTAVVQGLSPGAAKLVISSGHRADTVPVSVARLALRTVTTGVAHTCGLAADSTAYCWGYGSAGALGTGDLTTGARPRAVLGGLRFMALRAGGDFTCGLVADGSAYCWGVNYYGQLGAGPIAGVTEPVPVSGGLHFTELGIMQETVCGLTAAGDAYCWGNSWSDTPGAVGGGVAFSHLYLGGGGTCAAALSDGSIWCWTSDGGLTSLSGLPPLDRFADGAWSQSCGVSGGSVYCWNPLASWFAPQQFAAVGAGHAFTCGLTGAGVTKCVGDDGNGQLGADIPPTFSKPPFSDTLVVGHTTVPLINMVVGWTHVCGFGTDGLLYCWGNNQDGQGGFGLLSPDVATAQPVMNQ